MVKDELLEFLRSICDFKKFQGWNIIWKSLGQIVTLESFRSQWIWKKIWDQIAIQKRFGVEMYFGKASG